jgi:hypothetical protein
MSDVRRVIGVSEILAIRAVCANCHSATEIAIERVPAVIKDRGAMLVNCTVCCAPFPSKTALELLARAITAMRETKIADKDWAQIVTASDDAP